MGNCCSTKHSYIATPPTDLKLERKSDRKGQQVTDGMNTLRDYNTVETCEGVKQEHDLLKTKNEALERENKDLAR